jgi:hypothetical protein
MNVGRGLERVSVSVTEGEAIMLRQLPRSLEPIASSRINCASRREVLRLASSGALAAAFVGASGLSRLTRAEDNVVRTQGLFASAEASPGEARTDAALASASGGQNGAAAVGSIASARAPVDPDPVVAARPAFAVRRQAPAEPMPVRIVIENGGPPSAPTDAGGTTMALPAAGSGTLAPNSLSRWGALFGAASAAAAGAILLRSRKETESADT